MWEKVRIDGKKKLKSNAVPTIFPTHCQPESSSTFINTNVSFISLCIFVKNSQQTLN